MPEAGRQAFLPPLPLSGGVRRCAAVHGRQVADPGLGAGLRADPHCCSVSLPPQACGGKAPPASVSQTERPGFADVGPGLWSDGSCLSGSLLSPHCELLLILPTKPRLLV